MSYADAMGDQGWGDYPDARGMGDLGSLSAAPFIYMPNLASVGSGSAYWPGDVSQDALALNFLGYIPDQLMASIKPSTGSQAGDMNAAAGAWDETFRSGVEDFQGVNGDTQDGWIGPQTRASLAAAVTAANLKASPIAPPQPISPVPPAPIVPPPGVLPAPVAPIPVTPVGPSPAPQQASSPNYLLWGGVAAGAALLLGVGYWALSD